MPAQAIPQEIQAIYKEAKTQSHREALDTILSDLLNKYHLHVRLGGAIYHLELN